MFLLSCVIGVWVCLSGGWRGEIHVAETLGPNEPVSYPDSAFSSFSMTLSQLLETCCPHF